MKRYLVTKAPQKINEGTHLLGLSGFCPRVQFRALVGLEFGLDITRVVAVKQMARQTSIQVAGSHVSVAYRICEVHVALHHDRLAMVRCMMRSNGVDQWAVANEPVVVGMAAQVERLVSQVVDRGERHQETARVGRPHEALQNGCRQREQHEHLQGIRWKQDNAPFPN